MDLTWFIMIYFLKGGWLIALNYRVISAVGLHHLFISLPLRVRLAVDDCHWSEASSAVLQCFWWKAVYQFCIWSEIGHVGESVNQSRLNGNVAEGRATNGRSDVDLGIATLGLIFFVTYSAQECVCTLSSGSLSITPWADEPSGGVWVIKKLGGTLKLDLVGGWPTPLKNMSSSMGRMTFHILWKIKQVPNHQPGMVQQCSTCLATKSTHDLSRHLEFCSPIKLGQKTLGPVFKEFPTLHTCKQSENSGKIPQ